jgi:hypothetical protein
MDQYAAQRAWNCACEAQLDLCYVRLRGWWTNADGWRTPTKSAHRLPKPRTIVNEPNEAEGHYLNLNAMLAPTPHKRASAMRRPRAKRYGARLTSLLSPPPSCFAVYRAMAATSESGQGLLLRVRWKHVGSTPDKLTTLLHRPVGNLGQFRTDRSLFEFVFLDLHPHVAERAIAMARCTRGTACARYHWIAERASCSAGLARPAPISSEHASAILMMTRAASGTDGRSIPLSWRSRMMRYRRFYGSVHALTITHEC